jgi:hypothetical protein
MKIKSSSRKKVTAIISLLVLILASSYLIAAYFIHFYPFEKIVLMEEDRKINKVDYGVSSKQQTNAPIEHSEEQSKTNSSALPPSDGGKKTTIEMAITAATIQPNGDLEVRTLMQTLQSGHCAIIVKSASTILYQSTSDTQVLSNSSTCDGFTVPRINLGSAQDVKVQVDYSSGNITGSASRSVRIP